MSCYPIAAKAPGFVSWWTIFYHNGHGQYLMLRNSFATAIAIISMKLRNSFATGASAISMQEKGAGPPDILILILIPRIQYHCGYNCHHGHCELRFWIDSPLPSFPSTAEPIHINAFTCTTSAIISIHCWTNSYKCLYLYFCHHFHPLQNQFI